MRGTRWGIILSIAMATAGGGCASFPRDAVPEEKPVRENVRFNTGWGFVRVEAPPAHHAAGRDMIPSRDWKVVRVSSQETRAEDTGAAKAFDGNPRTFWLTRYQGSPDDYPHELVLDLGKAYDVEGFTYLPRGDGRDNSWIRGYELYVSLKTSGWGAPVATGEFRSGKDLQVVDFAKPKTGRYARFVALSSITGTPYAAVAELGLIKVSPRNRGKDWDSQFSTQHVDQAPIAERSGDSDESFRAEMARIKDARWERVTLPHTARIEPLVVNNQWEGICYYRKTFTLPREDKGKRITLEFEGAMQLADVWLNGRHKLRHAGGYTPFSVDLTQDGRYGGENEILVKLDNRDNPDFPPGKPLASLGFTYYHGIYRDVFLRKTNRVYITNPVEAGIKAGGGVFVTYPEVSEERAKVDVRTHVRNEYEADISCMVSQGLLDGDGELVAKAESQAAKIPANGDHLFAQSISVSKPNLWHPGHPYLYTLHTTVSSNGKVVDETRTRVGIRSFTVSRAEGLRINGKPLILRGTNRHQEYPYIGNALSDNAQYRDLWKIRNAGLNFARLAHYPQDPSVLDACDELGLLVADPIPGWQFFNKNPVFTDRVLRDIRDMIRRDRNHPCVVIWEVSLNESYPPYEFRRQSHAVAREEFIGSGFFTAGDCFGPSNWDIPFNEWDDGDKSRPLLGQPDSPGLIREYGDYEFGGGSSTTRQFRGDGEAKLLQSAWNFQWSHNRNRSQYPWTIGDANWSMYDYNEGDLSVITASGLADIFRLPKFAYFFFQSQRDPKRVLPAVENGPLVYVANYWTKRESPSKVIVYSNCDEVELFVNGKLVERRKPDAAPDTLYGDYEKGGNPYDGGNARHLERAPFTFTGVQWEPGELKAVGHIAGKKAAEHAVRTPGEPKSIALEFDTCGRDLAADGADTIFVYARVLDEKGTLVPSASSQVRFDVSGPGGIVGPAAVDAEAGIATILLRAAATPGKIRVRAASPHLKTGGAAITSR